MVKKFTYPCDFNGKKHPVTFYIGNAAKGNHPIGFQSQWLSEEKGGVVPEQLMESLMSIKKISDEQKVEFSDLCEYVLKEIEMSNEVKATKITKSQQKPIEKPSDDSQISSKNNISQKSTQSKS